MKPFKMDGVGLSGVVIGGGSIRAELTAAGEPPPKPQHFSREVRNQIIRATHRLNTKEFRDFPGSGGAVHRARVEHGGRLMCSCMGWTARKKDKPRQCKHTRELAGDRAIVAWGEFTYLKGFKLDLELEEG